MEVGTRGSPARRAGDGDGDGRGGLGGKRSGQTRIKARFGLDPILNDPRRASLRQRTSPVAVRLSLVTLPRGFVCGDWSAMPGVCVPATEKTRRGDPMEAERRRVCEMARRSTSDSPTLVACAAALLLLEAGILAGR